MGEDELLSRVLALYKPPFRYDRMGTYIWDANNEMVADGRSEDPAAFGRIRGWGRIGYMKDPEALQDKVGEVVALALTQFWERQLEPDYTDPENEADRERE